MMKWYVEHSTRHVYILYVYPCDVNMEYKQANVKFGKMFDSRIQQDIELGHGK